MKSPSPLIETAVQALQKIRRDRPLVHNITNYVVMNSTANGLLALGAAPVMAHAQEEAAEMAALAGALVLNIGTLSPAWIHAMDLAARAARARGIPVILDPVGAGATRLRTSTAMRLMDEGHPDVLRANASELLALASDAGG
ncbi:MAG: hydroxyethylthiazole kinase, partial [Kiritimatiellae bacterium]|nr:hydroxyethylthiazole kinase [Kiritimatiellia bacterium]